MSRDTRETVFRPGQTTNWALQSQKKARSLKVWILVEEGLYYPCSENNVADTMCSYCTADMANLFSHNVAHVIDNSRIILDGRLKKYLLCIKKFMNVIDNPNKAALC